MTTPPSRTEFKIIVALCRGGGIGYEGKLPWPKIDRDLRFFSEMTRSKLFPYNSAVVMGRKTWESIPASACPLPFRDNFIVSALHDADTLTFGNKNGGDSSSSGVTFIKRLSDIYKYASNYDVVWVIGGASMYEQVLTPSPPSEVGFTIDDIYVTFVDESYEYDTAFPLMYQYDSVDEWQNLRNNYIQRSIWCWTDADTIPKYVSFFSEGTQSNNVYRVTDVDRDFVATITRPGDVKAIQERRTPNTLFLRLRRIIEV